MALTIVVVSGFLLGLRIRVDHQEERHKADMLVRDINERMNEVFAYSELAAMTMAQGIRGGDSVPGFEALAQSVLESNKFIDAVQMVPKGVIRQVYPFEEHKVVIGYDIMSDPNVNKEAQKAISSKRMFFAGPFELRQGGLAVVGRLPVYRDGSVWGFSAVIIRFNRLLENAGIDNSGQSGYYFQLGKIDPNTGEEKFFMESPVKPSEKAVFDVTSFPDAGWKIYLMQAEPNANMPVYVIMILLGLIVALLGGYAVTVVLQRGNELAQAHRQLAWQHQEMSDSMLSARYLQKSVLHTEADVKELFPNSFAMFEPRDAVSGDFLWTMGQNGHRLIAVVDCTGHGVSAALMSMIAGQLLYQTVVLGKEYSPAGILTALDKSVTSILQSKTKNSSMHGMDMIICRIDEKTKQVTYAGANRPLYIVRKEEVEELPCTRLAIGGYVLERKVFTEQTVKLGPGDQIYLTTDGFHSQFGGAGDKKMGRRRFRNLLADLHGMPCDDQAAYLQKRFANWKGNQPQVDDVLVVGIKP